jgi:uncharacterized protein (UPF0128 family)
MESLIRMNFYDVSRTLEDLPQNNEEFVKNRVEKFETLVHSWLKARGRFMLLG